MDSLFEYIKLVGILFLVPAFMTLAMYVLIKPIIPLMNRFNKTRMNNIEEGDEVNIPAPFKKSARILFALSIVLLAFLISETTLRVIVALVLVPTGVIPRYLLYVLIAMIYTYSAYLAYLGGKFIYRNLPKENETLPERQTADFNDQ